MSTNAVEQQRQLTPNEWAVTNATEQLYYINGSIPPTEKIAELAGVAPSFVEKCFQDSLVVECLTGRGISVGASPDLLSTEQLAAMAVFFDTKDGRSLKKKLNDIGVTTIQWDAWKKEPVFSSHLRERAESSLLSNISETEVALMDSAHRGDISAIKLHLEMAGRWSSKTVGELNVEFLLMKIIEAAQRTIKDKDMLEAFANEVLQLAPGAQQTQPAINPAGTGQQTYPL